MKGKENLKKKHLNKIVKDIHLVTHLWKKQRKKMKIMQEIMKKSM